LIPMTFINKRILLAIGFVSAAIIAFQLALMQILSIVQWYHFAYMVISVALLGFGAAGTVLSIFRRWLLERFELALPLLMIFSGITMAVATGLSQSSCIRFDSYLLFADLSHTWRLALTYLIFFIPFFFGALAIGLVFVRHVHHIGRLYFANLIGSGAGGVVAICLAWIFLPQELPAIIAVLPIISGIIVVPKKSRHLILLAASLAVIIITFIIIHPPCLVLSEFKGLSRALNLPEAKITLEKSSPYGLIQVVGSPALRYAPGLSLTYEERVPITKAVFNNGDRVGPVISRKQADIQPVMDYTTRALAYSMARRDRVLVLDAGTGTDVLHAITRGAKEIAYVEPNSALLGVLKGGHLKEVGSLFDNSRVSIHNTNSRTYLLTDTSQYDLIILPMVGAFGGTCGLYALSEQYLFTTEAFRQMWLKLTPDGVISITCWMDYPLRNPLKILSSICEVLEGQGIENPADFIAAVRSWGTISVAVKRSPLSAYETGHIRSFCTSMLFDPLILPDIREAERAQFNVLADNHLFRYVDEILSSERGSLYKEYDFNIRPATDNRPYFSQFLRWQSLPHLARLFGERVLPFFEIGYLMVALTLIQISIAGVLLIILPLFSIGWRGGNKSWTVLYFSGIGIGYMFVEIIFIQRFILYLGNPIYSAALVISSMLVCSGTGSFMSSKWTGIRKSLPVILGVIIVLIFCYAIILTPILLKTITVAFEIKLLLAFLFVAPLSFFMGIPFPVGIGLLAGKDEKKVPWAWGINGCLSVVSTAVATIIAVEIGFFWVMVFACLAYALPLTVNIKGLFTLHHI